MDDYYEGDKRVYKHMKRGLEMCEYEKIEDGVWVCPECWENCEVSYIAGEIEVVCLTPDCANELKRHYPQMEDDDDDI